MEHNKISIIVPIYNAEKYLERCINSIINQTYKNIELILVDDGSNDGSNLICERLSNSDNRVRLFTQKNSGVCAARNLGLNNSQGDYISFVDADDFIDVYFCENMLQVLLDNGADIACCMTKRMYADGHVDISGRDSGNISICNCNEFEYYKEKGRRVVWGAIYKKNVIDNIRFDEDLFVGEDTLFFAKAVCKSQMIVYYDKPLYNYALQLNSAYHGEYNEKKHTELEAWKRICDIFTNKPITYLSAEATYAEVCLDMLRKYTNDVDFGQTVIDEIIKIYRNHLIPLIRFDINKKISIHKHVFIGIFPHLFVSYRRWKKTYGKN